MKKDIRSRADIELLVNAFYEKVLADEQLGFIFKEKANVNWPTHLPAMYNFWENIILHTGTYEGNPMHLHQHLHHLSPLTKEHFEQWNQLFITTVNNLFDGANARLAIRRAISISLLIRTNILTSQDKEK